MKGDGETTEERMILQGGRKEGREAGRISAERK